MSDYPLWICAGCGNKHGKTYKGQLSTFHEPDPNDPTDRCGWCGSSTAILTEPRDYGYPETQKKTPPKEGKENDDE